VNVKDPVTVVLAVGSLAVSGTAFFNTESNTDRQQEFQQQIEERQSAPRLAPGVELSQRGKEITVFADSGGTIDKRAERLLVERRPPYRIVMPMRNIGLGVAIMLQREFPTPVSKCPDPSARLSGDLEALGYYNIPAGQSDQLIFRPYTKRRISEYRAASQALKLNLLLKYTDVLQRQLRWSCVRYTRPSPTEAWSIEEPFYGQADGAR
jgi:hypothetical protein